MPTTSTSLQPLVISTPLSTDKNNNLNLLRLVFASLVLVSHAPELRDGNRSRELLSNLFGTISFGDLAVDGFFLLSGYLIVKSWERKPELRDYIEKRIRRIYPGFIVASLLSIFVLAPWGAAHADAYYATLDYKRMVINLFLLNAPGVPPIFEGTPNPLINGAMWSISYEFRCYAIVALLGLLGARYQKKLWAGLLLLTLGLNFFPAQLHKVDFPGLFLLLGNFDDFMRVFSFFCAGACFYFFRSEIPSRGPAALAAFVLLLVGMSLPLTANLALATVGGYALFWLAFARIPALHGFQRVEDISYGVYLYGWPMQKLLDWYMPTTSPWLLVPIAFILCCLAGWASWHLVESKFIVRAKKLQQA